MYQHRSVLVSGNGQGHSGILPYSFQHVLSAGPWGLGVDLSESILFRVDNWSTLLAWKHPCYPFIFFFFRPFPLVLMINVCPLGNDDSLSVFFERDLLLIWYLWLNTWVPCLYSNCEITK